MTQQFYSPLRYPGGKGKLLRFVKDVVEINSLGEAIYCEPYAGGAGIAIGLLLDGYVDEIHINDIDVGIFSFWSSILEDTEQFLRKIWDTPVTIDQWNLQSHIYKNREQYDPLEVGFSTFFLNRTNRSGVLDAGVIGGSDQRGNYKIDARFNKSELARRIKAIACHKDHVNIYCEDAAKFVSSTIPAITKEGLVFLDPPYFVKGSRLYTSFYKRNDHEDVAKIIKESDLKYWIVTYDNCDEISQIYSWNNRVEYSLRYSLNHKSSIGSEQMFYSESLQLPYHPSFKASA